MELKDYYQILNVSQDARAEDIKRAFRRLALQHHPDRNPGNVQEAGEKFKEINEADRLTSLSSHTGRTIPVEDIFNKNMGSESMMEMIRRMAGMGFVAKGMGWGKPWSCGRRQGGQCRRQWRQDVD